MRFYLHEGDWVQYRVNNRSGKIAVGLLILRPYGRRLWGAVRDGNTGQVHYLSSRKRIKGVVPDPEDLDQFSDRTVRAWKRLKER